MKHGPPPSVPGLSPPPVQEREPGTWRFTLADGRERILHDVYPSTDSDLPGCVVMRNRSVSPTVVAVLPAGSYLYLERVAGDDRGEHVPPKPFEPTSQVLENAGMPIGPPA